MKGERTVEKRRERNTKKTLLDIYSKYGIILILILIFQCWNYAVTVIVSIEKMATYQTFKQHVSAAFSNSS